MLLIPQDTWDGIRTLAAEWMTTALTVQDGLAVMGYGLPCLVLISLAGFIALHRRNCAACILHEEIKPFLHDQPDLSTLHAGSFRLIDPRHMAATKREEPSEET